jgi:dihydrofolate reductase
MRLVVINHVTLDGVMQGPGRPGEDTRNGFSHSGGAVHGNDEVMDRALGERMGSPDGGLLLGRSSYDGMLASWSAQRGPYKDALNAAPKYVVSTNPATRLEWPNSNLLRDVPAAVVELKQSLTGDLVIMGSGQLIRSLLPDDLIDEYMLFIHPLVLGSGQRLFEHENHPVKLRLVESTATTTGVIIATYHPER